ncbi:hypothetical protein [Streptomyces griseorubiginosus]|uniref:hypothetical protein n=1 Tax=Streptomyces griseorubiginosus TaxID=67304 RepID=UPI001FCC7CD3|nr:hypothetical protein [Streptomyces griseorubiginosus]
MDAARLFYTGVYGSWSGPLLTAIAVMFVFALLTQGSAWMIADDRDAAAVFGVVLTVAITTLMLSYLTLRALLVRRLRHPRADRPYRARAGLDRRGPRRSGRRAMTAGPLGGA